MMPRVKTFIVAIVMFGVAMGIDLIVHEGGHALVAKQFGAEITSIQFLWLNINKTEVEDRANKKWQWDLDQWQFGQDTFGSVQYNLPANQTITSWRYGLISVMGSGSSMFLSIIALVIMYRRATPTHFPWLVFFIALGGMIDMFTYAVAPMIGQYVTLANPEQIFDVSCNGDINPRYRPSDFPKPPSSFEPQVRTVQVFCKDGKVTVQLAVEFDSLPDIERSTRLFFKIETPEEAAWRLSSDAKEYKTDNYVAVDFFDHLHPISGAYQVNQAFIVLNGLPRLIFFYDTLRDDGFTDPEPLYGAVKMNINPYLFMILVSVISIIQGYFLVRYILRFRRQPMGKTQG